MKKTMAMLLASAMLLMTACGQAKTEQSKAEVATTAETTQASQAATEVEATQATTEVEATQAANEAATEETTEAETTAQEGAEGGAGNAAYKLSIGSLKGPTTMGLVNMMDKHERGELPFDAEFTMAVTPDELTAKLVSGDLDIALIPANLSAVLNQKLAKQGADKGISVININTLGVIYGVTGDESIKSLEDLRGKDVYMTGQGATPEFAFRYILEKNGLADEVNIIFKNEATEIAALLNKEPKLIAVLPQPFATVCMAKNDSIKEFISLTEEWSKVSEDGSQMVTGVTVIRNEALKELPAELISTFVDEQRASVDKALADVDTTAELIAKYGIIEKAPIAKKALPKCNLSCITGEEMKSALSGYLNVLYGANPKSVGGKLPDDSFYYIAD